MKTIAEISNEIRDELLCTQKLTPRLAIEYACNGEEYLRLHDYPHLDKVDEYFLQLGRSKRRSNPDDRVQRLVFACKATALYGDIIETVVLIVLDIEHFAQSTYMSKIIRKSGRIIALVSMDIELIILNHLLLSFLRGFWGEQKCFEMTEKLLPLITGHSERPW